MREQNYPTGHNTHNTLQVGIRIVRYIILHESKIGLPGNVNV